MHDDVFMLIICPDIPEISPPYALIAATSRSKGHSVSPQKFLTLCSHSFHPKGLKFGMESVCVCACLCVHAIWLNGGTAVGVAYCKKTHNFQTDSQTCT